MSNFETPQGGKRDPLYRKKHAGVPGNGGQTAEHPRSESGVSLVDARFIEMAEQQNQVIRSRTAVIREAGYLNGTTVTNAGDPRTTAQRAEWWERAAIISETGGDRGIPQMPEDNTPNHRAGLAESGLRRTHRMRYEGANFTIRMPSNTALNRFADELAKSDEGHTTFDVPVEAVGPAGNVIQGWVRSTRLPGGSWSTSPVGFSGDAGKAMSEAVCAIAEARRGGVRGALRNHGNLIERALERERQSGVEMSEVTSSWISGAGYDPENRQMLFTMNGKTYTYSDVSAQEAQQIFAADSMGKVFHAVVGRGKNQRKPGVGLATPCPSCRRMRTPGQEAAHVCPAGLHNAPTERAPEMNAYMRAKAERVAQDPEHVSDASRMRRPVNFGS